MFFPLATIESHIILIMYGTKDPSMVSAARALCILYIGAKCGTLIGTSKLTCIFESMPVTSKRFSVLFSVYVMNF